MQQNGSLPQARLTHSPRTDRGLQECRLPYARLHAQVCRDRLRPPDFLQEVTGASICDRDCGTEAQEDQTPSDSSTVWPRLGSRCRPCAAPSASSCLNNTCSNKQQRLACCIPGAGRISLPQCTRGHSSRNQNDDRFKGSREVDRLRLERAASFSSLVENV